MARRKKHMKLPNGYGHIKYLGNGRRNPYGAYPPVTEWTAHGAVQPKALGYYPTWDDAYQMLTAWHMERDGLIKVNKGVYIDHSPTFAECYEMFFKEKFESNGKKLSESSKGATVSAFKNCASIHDRKLGELRYDDLQAVVNRCPLGKSALSQVIGLMHQMYKYALKRELVEKDYSEFLYLPNATENEKGVPFLENDIELLKKHDDDDVCKMLLVMCFSGFRITAYTDMEINLEKMYFRGGVKTAAGKDRIVPIHTCIKPYVEYLWDGSKNLLGCHVVNFRRKMNSVLLPLGIANAPTGEKHTPHDCRHTFSMLCEKYGVNENDRKRMMGHSFGSDITNEVYGHRELEDLRKEIEKIHVPCFYE